MRGIHSALRGYAFSPRAIPEQMGEVLPDVLVDDCAIIARWKYLRVSSVSGLRPF